MSPKETLLSCARGHLYLWYLLDKCISHKIIKDRQIFPRVGGPLVLAGLRYLLLWLRIVAYLPQLHWCCSGLPILIDTIGWLRLPAPIAVYLLFPVRIVTTKLGFGKFDPIVTNQLAPALAQMASTI